MGRVSFLLGPGDRIVFANSVMPKDVSVSCGERNEVSLLAQSEQLHSSGFFGQETPLSCRSPPLY